MPRLGALAARSAALSFGGAGGEAVGQVRAGELAPPHAVLSGRVHPLQVEGTACLAPPGNSLSDLADARIEGHLGILLFGIAT